MAMPARGLSTLLCPSFRTAALDPPVPTEKCECAPDPILPNPICILCLCDTEKAANVTLDEVRGVALLCRQIKLLLLYAWWCCDGAQQLPASCSRRLHGIDFVHSCLPRQPHDLPPPVLRSVP